MPLSNQEHLSEEKIQDYIEGITSRLASELIENHLNSCKLCMETFEALALSQFRIHAAAEARPSEEQMLAAYQDFQNQIRHIHKSEAGGQMSQNGH